MSLKLSWRFFYPISNTNKWRSVLFLSPESYKRAQEENKIDTTSVPLWRHFTHDLRHHNSDVITTLTCDVILNWRLHKFNMWRHSQMTSSELWRHSQLRHVTSRVLKTAENGVPPQGRQIWPTIGSDCYRMGQIRDFLRSFFCSFWLTEPKWTEKWS